MVCGHFFVLFPFFAAIVYFIFFHITKDLIQKYKPLILRSETLILVKISEKHSADAIKILQEVEGVNTLAFLFRQDTQKERPHTFDVPMFRSRVENF